jgi:hypothetical protein
MLWLVSALKLVAEVALLALLGQGVLGLLVGARRRVNLFYRLLQSIASPFVRLARLLAPRVVLDQHVPLVAFILLLLLWTSVTLLKIRICLSIGVALCK